MKAAPRGEHYTPRHVAVSAIVSHEAIGEALAGAYPANEQTVLPEDMVRLLERLDNFGK